MLELLNGRSRTPYEAGAVRPFVVSEEDRQRILQWTRAETTPARIMARGIMVLLAGLGCSNGRIAAEIGVNRRTVALWKRRYLEGGPAALRADAPGRGRKPGRNRHVVHQILETTRQAPPAGTRWTVRTLARAVGVSHATVQRVWREHGITRRDPISSSSASSASSAAD